MILSPRAEIAFPLGGYADPCPRCLVYDFVQWALTRAPVQLFGLGVAAAIVGLFIALCGADEDIRNVGWCIAAISALVAVVAITVECLDEWLSHPVDGPKQ